MSWIVAPEAYTEHPAWPAGYGAWYTAEVLDALTSNPEVWSKTALLITFDENDGFFDHVVAPYPNVGGLAGQSTVPLDNELFDGKAGTPRRPDGVVGPYGLGVRVPMLVVSPWSTGGWVCSETFDHTSLIRFIEARFGVDEPNITPWRRAVCGDLTSAFDFESASDRVPPLPSVAAYKPTGTASPPYHPDAAGGRIGPGPGTRGAAFTPARLPRPRRLRREPPQAQARGREQRQARRSPPGAIADGRRRPYSYTIGAGDRARDRADQPRHLRPQRPRPEWLLPPLRRLSRDGAARRGAGRPRQRQAQAPARRQRQSDRSGHRRPPVVVQVADAYGADRHIKLHRTREITIDTRHSGGWYDIALRTPSDASFSYQLAGRLESGARLTSDPQLGR